VAVKLSPFYTSIANVVSEVDKRGAKAVVLFNRFLQPDIDPKTETLVSEMVYSSPEEMKLPLRWVALIYGRVKTDLALNTGVHSGLDAAKALLAGAQIVQTASALHKQGIPYISTMIRELEGWMDEHDYKNLDDFRGKMSQRETDDPFAFERAQYMKLLLGQQ
ncbi:MAG: dihydroorotate dehydrogenase-like protein, partial [Anaerolineales bacterium]